MTFDPERVLLLAPSGRDADLASQLLTRHHIATTIQNSVTEICEAIPTAACVIIASESLTKSAREELAGSLADQPAWSDFPIILLAPPNSSSQRAVDAVDAIKLLGNVTLLERPVRTRTLLSAVEAARRARRRQYEAREAIRRRDQFLAMLGHELRNPLAAIVLALESLEMIGGDVGLKQRRILDRQSRHLARLVDDLLDVARVTMGKVTLQLAEVELGEIVQRCVQGAELAARERSIRLRVDVPGHPLPVLGDAVRIEEIFNNLITNALKYSPEGSRVDVTATRNGETAVVEVRDTGVGIAADMLPRVFELFAQAEGSLARSQGGLGIGLTLVRSLVELHEGSIDAQSPGLGKGSTFTVRFPLRASSVVTTSRLTLVPPSTSLRVVIVDDNPDILEMTGELLESFGCIVQTAADGPSGVDAVRTHHPDLAIIDIGLPDMDGYEVARRINELPDVPYLVALTGYGQSSDRERALNAGFDEHLIKPVTYERLQRVVTQCKRQGTRQANS